MVSGSIFWDHNIVPHLQDKQGNMKKYNSSISGNEEEKLAVQRQGNHGKR